MDVRSGKAWDDSTTFDDGPCTGEKTGWFIGAFDGLPEDLRKNEFFEVKWYPHPKGQKSGPKPPSRALTLSVLISGKFAIRFREGGGESVESLLKEPGDYLIWGPGLEHEWEALEDSVVLSVRPVPQSIPDPKSSLTP